MALPPVPRPITPEAVAEARLAMLRRLREHIPIDRAMAGLEREYGAEMEALGKKRSAARRSARDFEESIADMRADFAATTKGTNADARKANAESALRKSDAYQQKRAGLLDLQRIIDDLDAEAAHVESDERRARAFAEVVAAQMHMLAR